MKESTKLIQKGKHFCVLPWIHFHAWPDGKVMPCCVADSNMPVSQIKPEESILEMMNSEQYKKMRVDMLNDKPSKECKRCYDLEQIGTWTMRQSHNMRRGMQYRDLIEATNPDGSIDEFKMKYMDIRFSNVCNMKCRSCGPSCSSLWAEEIVKNHGEEHYQKYFHTKKIVINNNEDQKFMAKLTPYLKDVEEVYFAGGEIIITPEHYECLDYWVKNDLTDQVELTYTTNFSVLKYKNKDLINYWKKFPKLKIWASLDAEGDLAEMMRKGTDWKKILKNLKRVKELVPHAEFQITPTISIWNVFQFPKFFDMLVDSGYVDIEGGGAYNVPRFNLATHPWYANIMILPEGTKQHLKELYQAYSEKYDKGSFNGFKMVHYNLEIGGENKGGILEFEKFNDELDKFRKENHRAIIPEINEVYKWAKT
jgi:hypothetical protein